MLAPGWCIRACYRRSDSWSFSGIRPMKRSMLLRHCGHFKWRICRPKSRFEIRPGVHDEVFPGNMAHLYKVRVVHGFSGFRPHSLYSLPADEFAKWSAQTADWVYETKVRAQREGILMTNATPGLARFQWLG